MKYFLLNLLVIAALSLSCQRSFAQGYSVEWTNVLNATVTDSTMAKTSATGWGNSGASSVNVLTASTDGWIESELPAASYNFAFGLTSSFVNTNYTSINFGIELTGTSAYVYENGTKRLTITGVSPYETFRIQRTGTTVNYLRNGVIIYTSSTSSSSSLVGDVALNTRLMNISNLTCSFPATGEQPLPPRNAIWTNLVGATATGSTLTKTAGDGWGTGGAATSNTLNPNTEGWVQFTIDNLNQQKAFGMSRSDVDANYTSIDYGFLVNGASATVILAGVNQTSVPILIGDVLRVERVGTSVLFKQNGTVVQTVANGYTTALIGDASIYGSGATISNVQASFWITYLEGTVPDQWEFIALKSLYDSLGGAGWKTPTNWPTQGNWPTFGVSAQFGTWYGVAVTHGDVSKIAMGRDRLAGRVPSAIASLTAMTSLALNTNNLSGSLPASLNKLINLTTLLAQSNTLSGSIPNLSGLTKLATLNLSSNRLTGPIPQNIGSLVSLATLTLNNNNFIGSIPDLSNLSKLKTLALNNNSLSGSIPQTIGNLTSLTNLTLSHNSLKGSIPNLSNVTNLATLVLNNNTLSGSIPQTLNNLVNLKTINLSNNNFIGDIPNLNKLTSITSFTMNSCPKLNPGPMPPWLMNNTKLTTLSMQNCLLTGHIPSTIGNLTALKKLYFTGNQLSGQLPTSIGNLTSLQYLYLTGNQIDGQLPSSIGNLTNLVCLYLDGNKIEGNLIPNIGNLTNLSIMYLIGNSFSGPFPSSVGTCSALTNIRADNNQFTSLPAEILNLPTATTLNFTHNLLSSIPNFGNHVNKAKLALTLSYNNLDFSQLEPQISAGIKTVNYKPQNTIQDIANISFFVNSTLTINARPPGQYSTITWQKQNGTTWTTVNSSNNNNTQQTYLVNNAPVSEEGTYRWSMTNTKVTDLTLTSAPIVVTTAVRLALDQWAYQYKYDGRRRMVCKRVPGADSVSMVYDQRDRLVLIQDGNHRLTNQWIFTKYDALDRPVSTGIYTPSGSPNRVTLQNTVNNYYNPANTNQWSWYETFSDATGNVHKYDDKSFPQMTDSTKYLTVTYYDDNTFTGSAWGANYKYTSDNLSSGTYAQPATDYRNVVGHVVGTKSIVLDGSNIWLKSVTFYDDRYRVIQTISDNTKGGIDRVSNLYDFTGRVLASKTTQVTATHPAQTVARNYRYDHAGRLLQTWHQVNSNPQVLLAQNNYNELGQLVTKQLYSTNNGSTFKQNVDQRYNIRGWLTSINNSTLTNDGGVTNSDNNDLFGMNLSYNDVISGVNNTPQYNGNISAIKWSKNQALGTTKDVAYNYSYDAMNRILNAAYLTDNAGTWSTSNAFAEGGFIYDTNGNILNLARTNSAGTFMDNLTYTYTGNQLQSVSDAGDILNGFIDGNIGSTDYVYDANGNMTVDSNKGITAITYNYHNQPQQVTKNTGEKMIFTNDANGKKLRQQVYNSSGTLTKTTDYDGDFIYQNDTLQFISHEEGRVVMKNVSAPEYQYHLKDQLGNVRLTFTTQPTIDTPIATFETANQSVEQSEFLRMDDARIINSTLFDHTYYHQTPPAAGAFSERLSGSANEKTGIARSISVMPGDTVKMEVYAKYVDGSNSNNTAALTQLLAQIVAGTASAGTVIDGANYSVNGITPFPYTGLAGEGSSNGTGPKSYLNYLVFDRNYVLVNAGYVQMSTAAKEDGTNVPHEKLSAQVVINQPGYVYVYLSNENTSILECYFDDLKVTQVKSPVVQEDSYYPFGLRFESYSRESSLLNRMKLFQGQEHIDDLGLNWDPFKWRDGMPDLGRFFNIDPLAEKYYYNSPYAFSENKVVAHIELEGLEAGEAIKFQVDGTISRKTQTLKVAGFTPVDLSGKIEDHKLNGGEDAEKSQLPREVANAKPLGKVDAEVGEKVMKSIEKGQDNAKSESGNNSAKGTGNSVDGPKDVKQLSSDMKAITTENKVLTNFSKDLQAVGKSYTPPSMRQSSDQQQSQQKQPDKQTPNQ